MNFLKKMNACIFVSVYDLRAQFTGLIGSTVTCVAFIKITFQSTFCSKEHNGQILKNTKQMHAKLKVEFVVLYVILYNSIVIFRDGFSRLSNSFSSNLLVYLNYVAISWRVLCILPKVSYQINNVFDFLTLLIWKLNDMLQCTAFMSSIKTGMYFYNVCIQIHFYIENVFVCLGLYLKIVTFSHLNIYIQYGFILLNRLKILCSHVPILI